MSEAAAIEQLSTSLLWGWTAIDPASKLLLSVQAGDRPLALAQAVLHQIAQLLASGCVPPCRILGIGCSRRDDITRARPPNRAGCRCPASSTRKWSSA